MENNKYQQDINDTLSSKKYCRYSFYLFLPRFFKDILETLFGIIGLY